MKQRLIAIALTGVGLASAPAWAADRVELTTRVSGMVEEVLVKPGQRVAKGAVLARLDRSVLQARVDEAAADQARAAAEGDDAKRDFGRAEELYNRTVSSSGELEAASLRHARARAALDAANARLAIAKKNLADAELRAPFAGVVAAVPGLPGTVVAECQPKTLVVLSR